MPDMLAIVSKAVFEREAGKSPALGTRLGMDRYVSSNKNLDPLASGGRLYLVTVRPPKEDLWLVAILDQPKHDGEAWIAKKSPTPLTDITKLRSKLKFQSGTGIQAKKGALGMSLQTPRALTAADTALLDQAAGAAAAAAPAPAADAADAAGADGLLAAILADPDHDDARRIYADLLAQQGDPRGEFILVELALDGPLSIRKREELAPRRRELYETNQKRWFPYALAGMRTHHGFLEAVKGNIKQLKAAGSKLFAAEPVTEVEVTDADEETVEPLLAAKWLPRVRRLILRGAVGDEGFAQICAARATAGLRTLNVNSNELGADALAELGDGLPACTTLVLSGNAIGDEGLAGLRAWKHLPGLETLYLSRCEISAKGLAALLAGQTLPRLDKLCLTDNDELGDAAADAIAASAARLPKLRHIEVVNTGIGEAGIRTLTQAKLPALRRIDARRNYLDDEELDAQLAADPRVRT
ncbi:MAG TPA: TIGR02996 domain-containing protein [Kofleriaceae bacterium]|nr:TIGR02996 domain-containing protein [Kofleriaceae bacterium]